MKVVFDPQIFSLQEYGGISRYFAELASHLHALEGTQVEVCSPWYASRYLSGVPQAILNVRASIPARRYIRYTRHLFTAANMALFRKRLTTQAFDIAHHTYYWPLPDSLSVHARVTTIHDMIDETIVPNPRKSSLKRRSVQQADHVICVSEHTRKALLECYDIAPEKVSVVHLGKPAPPPLPPATPDERITPYILYIGERGGYKNFGCLAQAFASSVRLSRDFQLVCFGGKPFSSDEIKSFAALGLASNQVQHCSGDDDMLIALYRDASLFVYPSLYEGFGLPPLEAMSMGTAVACSDATSIPEVVGKAGEYFDPTRMDSIMHAMESVLYAATRRQELIALGHERSAHFSWDRCARETLDIYRTLT
ncbi:MAG: glycosyltransferase family 1 protein [Gallionellaceae bacterium]|nr:glycosyltransferase family 1 protein [Gallionellaceae bacterium]